MTHQDWVTEQFEVQRRHLFAVAYRMLGSRADAEDAVQEAWLRLNRGTPDTIADLRSWLTTVVGRICLDMLRSRRSRRESNQGTWLPEPLVVADPEDGPDRQAELTDAVGLALLVVLETLTPAERLAFVLHDIFAVPFEEIGSILDRTPTAARQLASRARRRVRGAPTTPDTDLARQREVVAAFLAAARGGDFDALLEILHPDVMFRIDIGSRPTPTPISGLVGGRAAVARHAATMGPRFARMCQPALVNGAAGIIARGQGGLVAVAGITVVDATIVEIDLILDPAKLDAIELGE
ncbi:RNA polymerase, sigma-24 subunit, ECF subfamily [Parafrankia sp. EAN1pec]|uniref:RNA polymerase sigma factor SigJ n=1 Tax=Parafrankia sp. (strain EAN1pec) TaxID=298653 RepID=UPI0000541706|nr:RNA polymerase, sigma-24 subunit, ECF subfamily [Frankia sp. EAN1pec]